MESFERNIYESLFDKAAVEVVRWDKIDSGSIEKIFCRDQIRLAAKSLVNYFDHACKTDDMREKLGRYLYPAGNFDGMMLFLRCAVRGEGCETMLEFLNQSFEQSNPYNEPLWVLWGRFLTDVLDVLRQWICCKDNVMERIKYF